MMKYFDIMHPEILQQLQKRGVMTDELLYCVKSDLDGEGCYIDTYVTFCKDELYVITGYEKYAKKKRSEKAKSLEAFDVTDFNLYELKDIKRLYVDRYQNAARLMAKDVNGKEFALSRFSLGFSDKFEKFCQRVNSTIDGTPIDDRLLEESKIYCPVCGERFPDPNRPVCPYCVDKHSIFLRLMGMFKEFRVEVILMIVTLAISTALSVLAPVFSAQMLYDEVLTKGGKYYGQIMLIVMLIITVDLLSMVIRVVSGIITSRITPMVTHKLRAKIFASLQNLSYEFFTSKQTGSLMSRVDRDSQNIYWFFTDIVPYGLRNIVTIIGITVIMMIISPILALSTILSVALINVVQTRFARSQRKYYRKSDIATRSANSVLSDVMNGQRVVKAFAKEDEESKRYNLKNTAAFEVSVRINERVANTSPFIWAALRFINQSVFCLGAYMVIKGYIQFGALAALISYTNMTYEPMHFFSWIGDRWARCIDAASRMFEIIDSEPTVKESDHPVKVKELRGDIELKNVTFEYEAGLPVIKDVSFKVEAGHMFGIVGKTGAGKSTIINLMARLYDVTGGEITIDGYPIKELSFADIRKNIGIVSQETYLFIGSIADNIRYARPEAAMEEVIQAAKSAYAHEFISRLPNGYNTMIGESNVNLSGGEKQRISIARAIIQKPNILILDEATASMDTRTERKIQSAIDDLKKGRTIISIAHRLSTLRDADMLCVIENGELKEMGTHDQLIRKKGKYFELYSLQSQALQFMQE